jgi:hypothetical protein
LVYSSGKPRIVTLYSGWNAEVLTPLHTSLYGLLARKGWLLVGSPTDEKVQALGASGVYVSVDYTSATDNIRAEYCRAAIAVLKEKAVGLTPRQSEALDVLGHLRFCDGGEVATRGQPMGSLMSFPLLCLINKTVVDLSLLDLAERGKISWKEFRVHRCLINGDDLLFREFDSSRGILAGILYHGSRCGLVLNEDKTMVSPDWAEVNSMAFYQGRGKKKTNVSVVEWRQEVSDPVGFVDSSVVTYRAFCRWLEFWAEPLRNAVRKVQGPLDGKRFRFLIRSRKLRAALTWRPRPQQKTPNPFPVVAKPAGYDLSRREEVGYISERVARLKERGYIPEKPVRCSTRSGEGVSIQSSLRNERPCADQTILKVLADAWYWKIKEKLVQEDRLNPNAYSDPHESVCIECYEGRHSLAQCLVEKIRGYKGKVGCANPDAGPSRAPGGVSPRVEWPDYVPLE